MQLGFTLMIIMIIIIVNISIALYNEHSASQEKNEITEVENIAKENYLLLSVGNKKVLRDRLKTKVDTASLMSQGSWMSVL